MMLAFLAGIGGVDAAELAAAWSGISATWPTTTANNEDRAITWDIGGARTVTASYGGSGTLRYRIDSGSWTDYVGGFSLNSGQTVAWRIVFTGDESSSVAVAVNSAALASFLTSASGFP